ncbi:MULTISPECIES: glycine cleavage system protein GcvH [unclassified Arcicella]|uniref:glycine cleavage system protein GcvH n=1 Tax=unclassified Arcicella TaxID=2644986 RepID=UPI002855DFE3|nr:MULTISPECIES: glycine cleavage system protein GcvH [unclassified Arcicella]MDR6563820.1 glycine cleavage system H protein [Arcicella sp. BE51]MDR6813496.1 glycine cleavage system H protein [Arcicella sp. BE140]MDR6824809.1 glycine cleavage system H protein [Arcicella sp. BE139]|eukprot:Opistho-1_new@77861
MEIPEEYYYSKEHTWLRIENEIGIVGITEFAQSELGEIVYVDLPNDGYKFKQDEIFGSVEALKTVSDLFMPVSGQVLESNKQLLKEPTFVNSDPFATGWIIKVAIENIEEVKNLLSAQQYKQVTNQFL